MNEIIVFLGKPVEYWIALKALVETRGIDGHIEEIAQLKAEIERIKEVHCQEDAALAGYIKRLEAEKTLLQAEIEAAGSLLLDVQQDCIELRKELEQLRVEGARGDDIGDREDVSVAANKGAEESE